MNYIFAADTYNLLDQFYFIKQFEECKTQKRYEKTD